MGETVGSVFSQDRTEYLRERLRYTPSAVIGRELGIEAQAEATQHVEIPTRWNLKRIQVAFPYLNDYTLSGIWRLLKKSNIRWRQGRSQQYSPDINYKAKEAHLLSVLDDASTDPGKIIVLFLDELTYYHWPEVAPDWCEKAPIARKARPGNTKYRIVGALDAFTGDVSYLQAYTIGNEKFVEFLHQIAKKYFYAEEIYIVLDNWRVHYHHNVKLALEELSKIQLVFLPTYSPWLNPIENLWDWLKADVIKMHQLAGLWHQLKQNVASFLDQFTQESRDLLRRVGLLGNGKLARARRGIDYQFENYPMW